MSFARFCATLGVALFLVQPVRAWNAEGHMVVAQIAYNHLQPDVKVKCDALIAQPAFDVDSGNTNFVTAACWADDIKSSPYNISTFSTWHYIDIPFSFDGSSTNVSFPASNVVQAINGCIAGLRNPASSLSNQAVYLRFLLHFVGDIQQPLHCSTFISSNHLGGDSGGNSLNLSGSPNNLHSYWDQGGNYLTDSVGRPLGTTGLNNLANKVADVEATYPYAPLSTIIPNPMDWASEGYGLAQTVSYIGITNGTTPTTAYRNSTAATTKQRMAAGGQRLADLLNVLFSPAPAVTTLAASNLTATTATLNGSVTPGYSTNGCYFQYGLTTNYGSFTSTDRLTTGSSPLAVNAALTGLMPATTYHCRAVATNLTGVTLGGDLTFQTATPVPPALNGLAKLGNGTFQFNFSNLTGATFTIFASTNVAAGFNTWSNLGPALETPAGSGQFRFTDPQATNNSRRFYRVRFP